MTPDKPSFSSRVKFGLRHARRYLEPLIWTASLILLFFLPAGDGGRSLCLFRFLGIHQCPGCGIGHAIHYALHLEFKKSFEAHFMGIPAVVILGARILSDVIVKKQPLFSPHK